MSFQIVDKDNQAIDIAELDRQAAEFWCVEVHSKYYAQPAHKIINWFDLIGREISSPRVEKYYNDAWENIKVSLALGTLRTVVLKTIDELTERAIASQLALLPYFSLIDHWKAKGYQPKRVDE